MAGEELTRRQEIARLLESGAWGFEELRLELELPRRLLEEELRHVERTLRAHGGRLRVEPATCRGCGFHFRARSDNRRFSAPGRCPRCRGERITQPLLSAEPGGR